MNDNYLWDKSGEPDEEVQHLEMLLSEFRYEPRPLVLPEVQRPTIKQTILAFVSVPTWRFAAVAAVALLALAAGIWISTRPAAQAPPVAVASPVPTPTQTIAPPTSPESNAPLPVSKPHPTAAPKAQFAKHAPKRTPRKALELEGERAKEKVLYALQITSEKLSLIAKKLHTDTN